MRLPPLPSLKEIIRLYKLRAQRQLSQNFLLDRNLTDKIVRSAGKISGGHVCEVGPGPGAITRSILEADVTQLVVIEKDQRFTPGLEMLNEASGGIIRIFEGDVLRFDMGNIFPEETARTWEDSCPNIHIIGNLPFNVSTPLIIKWLEDISQHSGAWRYGRVKLTLTFQKEVAERLAAPMLHAKRSRLSIISQYLCHVTHKFTIPGKAFVPKPDVDVGVVRFVPRVQPQIDLPFKVVEKVVRHVFHYRQKMCKRGIQTLFPPDRPELTAQMFELAEVPTDSRSYMLHMSEFDRLCQAYKHICDLNPGLMDYYYRAPENVDDWRKKKVPLTLQC